jgi:hypothetical protein
VLIPKNEYDLAPANINRQAESADENDKKTISMPFPPNEDAPGMIMRPYASGKFCPAQYRCRGCRRSSLPEFFQVWMKLNGCVGVGE